MGDLVYDKLGWVDDFRALPGECGSDISRRIYLHSLMNQGISLRQIKQMGFSKEMVTNMNKQLVSEEYGPKVGDLVKFNKTGATAMIIEMTVDSHASGGYVSLYIGDGTLDNTPSADGFTHMSVDMLERTATVVKNA